MKKDLEDTTIMSIFLVTKETLSLMKEGEFDSRLYKACYDLVHSDPELREKLAEYLEWLREQAETGTFFGRND